MLPLVTLVAVLEVTVLDLHPPVSVNLTASFSETAVMTSWLYVVSQNNGIKICLDGMKFIAIDERVSTITSNKADSTDNNNLNTSLYFSMHTLATHSVLAIKSFWLFSTQ